MYMHMYMYVHCMQQTSTGEWTVESMSGCNPSGYTVKCIHSTCPECSIFEDSSSVCKATECFFLCSHMYYYTCDSKCYDYNNGHIHRVHSLLSQSSPKISDSVDQEIDYRSPDDNISYAESVFDPHKGTITHKFD